MTAASRRCSTRRNSTRAFSSASTGVIAASNNSSAIVYTTGANAGGTIGNIEGANGDGSSPMPLVTNVDIDNTASSTCIGVALFDQAYAVVQACPIDEKLLRGFQRGVGRERKRMADERPQFRGTARAVNRRPAGLRRLRRRLRQLQDHVSRE